MARMKIFAKLDPTSSDLSLISIFGDGLKGVYFFDNGGSGKSYRTFCSCGAITAQESSVCPECGGKLKSLNGIGRTPGTFNTARDSVCIYEISPCGTRLKFTEMSYEIGSSKPSGEELSFKVSEANVGTIVKNASGNYDFEAGARLSRARIQDQEKFRTDLALFAPEIAQYLEFYKVPVSIHAPALALHAFFCVQRLPNVFTPENLDKNAEFLNLLINRITTEFTSAHQSILTLPSVSTDTIKTLMSHFHLTEEYAQYANEIARAGYSFVSIKSPDAAKEFAKSTIGKIMLHRLGNGLVNWSELGSFINFWHDITNLGSVVRPSAFGYASSYGKGDSVPLMAEEADCFEAFIKDALDTMSVSQMLEAFVERIFTLREKGITPTPDNIRSRNYCPLINVSAYRTLKNTNVLEMIDKDPVGLIQRLRK